MGTSTNLILYEGVNYLKLGLPSIQLRSRGLEELLHDERVGD
jgi:hypothetical protein